MPTALVLTVIADDRPGIVEKIADRILTAGANWEESRMARLAGKFAGLLRVSVDEAHADALAASLTALSAEGLTVVVERTAGAAAPAFRAFRLDLVGNDRAGIVRDISRVLARQGVNIDELETDVTSAPMTGETLFRARAHVRVPAAVTIVSLRAQLESLAGELMVDLALEDA
jgi:glycine cleavage system regulatory protein